MKAALISYHKNIDTAYQPEWIKQYQDSVLNQTVKEFDIFELNYGGGQQRIFKNSTFVSHPFSTFVDGMNYMLDCLFPKYSGHGYDCVFNTNVDDYYAADRIEKQLFWMERGYDLVSSNYTLIRDDQVVDITKFHDLDIGAQLNSRHNIIAHPAVCYSKQFWKKARYNPNEIPYEDMYLWQRSLPYFKFKILPDNLLFYRLHNNSICQTHAKR